MNFRNGQIIFVIGVSGVGKTTIARLLASHLELPYREADDFHSAENVEKMSQGVPLTDRDRKPWLEALNKEARELSTTSGAVITCSALKQSYRSILENQIEKVIWVFLKGDFELIQERISERKGHYMPPELLQSQFDTLEEPCDAITVVVSGSPENIIEEIITKLNER